MLIHIEWEVIRFFYILSKINWFVIAYSWLLLIVRRGRVAWGANLPLRAGCWCSVCAATAQGACGANSVRRGSGAWSQVCMNTSGPWCVWSQFSQEGVRSVAWTRAAHGACGANSVKKGSGAWSPVCMIARGPWCVGSQLSPEGVRSVVSGMFEHAVFLNWWKADIELVLRMH